MQSKVLGLSYAEREKCLSPGARKLVDVTWVALAKRCLPDMPEAEAVAAFKALHAAGLIELAREGDGLALKIVAPRDLRK